MIATDDNITIAINLTNEVLVLNPLLKGNVMRNQWRVMGMWDDGRQFLVVMGSSQKDCQQRIYDALADYSLEDLEKVDSLWYEQWKRLPWEDEPRWEPESLISMRRYKLLKHRRGQKKPQTPPTPVPSRPPANLKHRLPPKRPTVGPVLGPVAQA